jgi:hypothetical protein
VRRALFDLNGTLLDPGCVADALGDGDADREIVAKAFSGALLLSMAATLSGSPNRQLDEYLAAALERELRARPSTGAAADAAARASAMDQFQDADAARRLLGDAGLRDRRVIRWGPRIGASVSTPRQHSVRPASSPSYGRRRSSGSVSSSR